MMKWIYWGHFVLGIWILVSPWILGYWRVTPALWSGVVAGALVTLLSLWQIVGVEDHNHHNENR